MKRQKQYAVVEKIGDIFLDAVPHFGPFVSYGAHQLYGKYEFEKEKNGNPAFAQFVEVRCRVSVAVLPATLTDGVYRLPSDFPNPANSS
jgi:hypothetical protein